MFNQAKNIMIGLFVLAALSILIFILLYLHPTVGDLGQTIHVRFDNIDKVTLGTRVTFGGKPIGEVTDIQEVPEARQENAIHPGPVYIYELTLKTDSHIKLYQSDTFALRTSGLLGERSIEITPGLPKKGKPLVLLNSKDIAFSQPSGSVEETVKQFDTLAKKAETTLDLINGQLVEIGQRKLWENLSHTAKNASEISTALNQPNNLADSVKNIHQFTQSLNHLLDRIGKTWTTVDEISQNFLTSSKDVNTMTKDATTVVAGVKSGEGTVGKLVVNDDLYLRITGLMSKANTTMDDINHYGLLFHNDKHWQRLRARRMNLLSKLSTPQEFRNFFDDEVDEISTSLSRVSMILNETTDQCMQEEIISSCEFSKVFADLLRRVKELENNLNLYDQQIVDIREKTTLENTCLPPGFEKCESIPQECFE